MKVRRVELLLAAIAFVCALASVAYAGDAKKGHIIYTSRCSFCHGATGKGDGPASATLRPPPTNLTSPDFWKSATAETMKAVIESGKPGTGMVSFKASLSAEQMDDLIVYLQSFKPPQ